MDNSTKYHVELYDDAVQLLKGMIAIPSVSRQEQGTAQLIADFMTRHGIENVQRHLNNVWAVNRYYDPSKPTILLNSHHDTVKPNSAYTRDPYAATVEGDRLYGLGSNDAGASGVSLLAAFRHFYDRKDLKYNLCIALTAEEENSGSGGLESIIPMLGPLEFAIVGEPTLMQLAIAERGLIVIDCVAHGRAGHAAREEGDNAIYKVLNDIAWFRDYRFPKESALLGPVKMSVTMVNAGTQHNVIPDRCTFVVDIRSNECYTNQELFDEIRKHIACEAKARSFRLGSSHVSPEHPLVKKAVAMGRTPFGSPTLSDQALMSFPSIKIGPGKSSRSHTADEFIFVKEIEEAIALYLDLLDGATI